MDLNALCAQSLLPHFRAKNLECGPASGADLSVSGLAMKFVASEATVISGHNISVTFDARALDSSEPGIRVTSVGSGDSIEVAAADAAMQWAVGVLPVIMSYVLRSHVCEVEKFPMIVGVADSSERYGWTVHLGPVIGRAYGGAGSGDSLFGDLSCSAAYTPIFHAVHPYAAHRRLMWVESFAARYYFDRKVDATCRIRNQDFEEGRDALLDWAAGWPETGAAVLSKRQFILLEPTALEELKGSAELSQNLDDEMHKSERT